MQIYVILCLSNEIFIAAVVNFKDMQFIFLVGLNAIFIGLALTSFVNHYQFTSVMGSSGKPQVYIDCGKMPNKITVEALPLNVSQEYTLFLIDQNKQLENYTDHQFSGKAVALGNGERFFSAIFPVSSTENDIFVSALYARDNTNSTVLAQGVAACSNPGTINSSGANSSSLEQLCSDIIAKHKDDGALKLKNQSCKPMMEKISNRTS